MGTLALNVNLNNTNNKHQQHLKQQDDFPSSSKLPRGLRSPDQQADQHGVLCQLRLSLHGFAKFFQKSSDEERDHGMKLMEYQAKRGGRVVFQDIAKPSSSEWGTPLQAMEA